MNWVGARDLDNSIATWYGDLTSQVCQLRYQVCPRLVAFEVHGCFPRPNLPEMWIVLTVSVHADLLYQSLIYEPVSFKVSVYRVMSRTRRLFSTFVLCMIFFSPVLPIIFFLIFRDIFCDIFCGIFRDILRDIFRLRSSPTIVLGVCGGLARLYNSTLPAFSHFMECLHHILVVWFLIFLDRHFSASFAFSCIWGCALYSGALVSNFNWFGFALST